MVNAKVMTAFACPLHLKLDPAFCEIEHLILAALLSLRRITVLVAQDQDANSSLRIPIYVKLGQSRTTE